MKKICTSIFSVILFLNSWQAVCQYSVLLNFDSLDGQYPNGNLLLDNGKFYGMTYHGGMYGGGLVFSIDTNGTNYKYLHNFNGYDGSDPKGSLIEAGNKLYGMTYGGGLHDSGTVFSVDTDGSGFKKLFDFGGTKGGYPSGSLVCAGKKLFGMTYAGGSGYGTAFSIDTDGTGYKDMINFYRSTGQQPHGSFILSGSILFGMTSDGGTGWGNIFIIDTSGNNYKDIFNFNGTNGGDEFGSLIISNNTLFGMNWYSGLYNFGTIYSLDSNGNNFKDLLDFDGINGASPWGDLSLIEGKLYGMTEVGGLYEHYGNLFSIDTDGSGFIDLHDFNLTDGANPFGSLTVSGNNFYGMTDYGGTDTDGVIFRYTNIPTSIGKPMDISNSVNVYPNPNSGKFNISMQSASDNAYIEIYNEMGQKVLTQSLMPLEINPVSLNNYSAGVYFFRIIKDDGGFIKAGKISVMH